MPKAIAPYLPKFSPFHVFLLRGNVFTRVCLSVYIRGEGACDHITALWDKSHRPPPRPVETCSLRDLTFDWKTFLVFFFSVSLVKLHDGTPTRSAPHCGKFWRCPCYILNFSKTIGFTLLWFVGATFEIHRSQNPNRCRFNNNYGQNKNSAIQTYKDSDRLYCFK